MNKLKSWFLGSALSHYIDGAICFAIHHYKKIPLFAAALLLAAVWDFYFWSIVYCLIAGCISYVLGWVDSKERNQ